MTTLKVRLVPWGASWHRSKKVEFVEIGQGSTLAQVKRSFFTSRAAAESYRGVIFHQATFAF